MKCCKCTEYIGTQPSGVCEGCASNVGPYYTGRMHREGTVPVWFFDGERQTHHVDIVDRTGSVQSAHNIVDLLNRQRRPF